ncbi:MAG: hypothetical protein Q8Q32_01040 [bacterium]|nr:hypothetical protein [bacterium]
MKDERKEQERKLVDRLARKALQVCMAARINFRDPSVFAAIGAAAKDVIQEEFPGFTNFAKRANLLPRVKKAIGRISAGEGQTSRETWKKFLERRRGGSLFGNK